MSWKLSNFMSSRLAQAIADSDTTIYVDADEVDYLPALGVGDKAKAVIYNASYREIVNITAWNTNGTLTVERAQESTTARDWAAGVKIVHTPTAEILQAVLDATVQAVYRGTATGTNSITVTGTGSVPTPSDGDEISFEVAATNTGAVDVSFTNGSSTIGPFDLVHQDGSAIAAGELVAGYRVKTVYDAVAGDLILVRQASKRYQITHINDGPLDAGNLLPNGGFDAWTNGTTFNTPASGTETADNVVVEYDGTIGAFTISRQDFTLGQTDVPGGPKHYLRWNQSSAGSASSYRRIRMRIPKINKHDLETLTAIVSAKADAARTVTVKLVESFGTGGAPSAEVILGTEAWSLDTDWADFDITDVVDSIAGKTLGSADNDGLILEFSLPINTSMTIDLAMAQVERGEVSSSRHSRWPLSWRQGGTGQSVESAVEFWVNSLQAEFDTNNPDLAAIEALASTGIAVRTASNTWAQRSVAVPTGMGVTNPAGVAGDITLTLGTALTDYVADPLSAGELASITGDFGTAAFVANNTLVHLAGSETVTGIKRFEQATATDIVRWGNTTNSNYLSPRWSSATLFELVPAPSGTPDTTKGFYYDESAAGWGVDTSFTIAGQALAASGSAAAPSYSFASDTALGFYRSSPNIIACAIGGSPRWSTNTVLAIDALWPFAGPAGSVSAPTFAYRSNTDLGMYFPTSTSIGWTVDSALVADISASRLLMGAAVDLRLPDSLVAPTGVYSVGFRGAPVISGNSAYAFPATDAGCTIYHDEAGTRTYTIPANASVAHPIGTMFIIDNTGNSGAAGAITLSITTDTLRRGDGVAGTGSRTIPASGVACIRKVASTIWVITGIFT